MPLVSVFTSADLPSDERVNRLLADLSSTTAKSLHKPEAFVMTRLAPRSRMMFGGTLDPACLVEIKTIGGLSADVTEEMSATLSSCLHEALGVRTKRIYLVFADVPAHLWGFDGTTFG